MPRFATLFGSSLLAVLSAFIAVGQPPATPAKLNREDQEKLQGLRRLEFEALRLENEGKLEAARAAGEKSLAIRLAVLGDNHPKVPELLAWLSAICLRLDDLPAAQGYAKEALAVCQRLHGEANWRTTDARLALANVELYQGLPKAKRAELAKADSLMQQLTPLNTLGEYEKAIKLAEQALALRRTIYGEKHHLTATTLAWLAHLRRVTLNYPQAEEALRQVVAIRKELLGVKHPDYAAGLNGLAELYHDQGDLAKAEPLYQESLAIAKEVLGEKTERYAIYLNNLALLYKDQGLFAKAEPLYRKSLAILRETVGEKHRFYTTTLHNLGLVYVVQGLYAKAEPLLKKVLAIRKEMVGEKHTDYAASLNSLAKLYHDQGQFAKAEPLYQEALAILKIPLGGKHLRYASILNNLAALYQDQGENTKAEPLYKQALALRKEAFGEKHPEYAASLNNLATLYHTQAQFAKAEPLYEEALAIYKERLGEKHPQYATMLSSLAAVYLAQGQFVKAESMCRQAVTIHKEVLGERHPNYATSLNNLAAVYHVQNQVAKAQPLYEQAIRIIEEHLEETAAIQSETAQLVYLAKTRGYLNHFLTLNGPKPADLYAAAFRWRGVVTARQAFARAARESDPKVQQTLEDLRKVAFQLSNLVNTPSKPGVEISKLYSKLSVDREKLEQELAKSSQSFAAYREYRKLTVADIQKLLPSDAVLVDFLALGDTVAAFVVTSQSIIKVDLKGGEELAELVKDFRQPISLKRTRPVQGEADESPLYTAVWEPLLPHLKHAKLVLICPDGPLCEVPFAALRGTDPKKYLIEEVSLAVIPVPRLLPELLAARPAKQGEPSLLVIGDVDFDGEPAAGKKPEEVTAPYPTRAGGVLGWSALPGSKVEVAVIEKLFRKAALKGQFQALTKGDASEAAIRREVGKYRYLHFATHGFFAAPTDQKPPRTTDKSLGDRVRAGGLSPGLLCGLVCAGANKPTPDDDGVLTALEIADLDLSGVEIAVLSACQTGLGDVAGGEGVLGLQRAFQLAGTRTTITSLWSVPDEATAALMTRFYSNRFEKGLSPLEALREAQLWMLNDPKWAPNIAGGRRTPPLNWAAFVLAGDWR